MQCALGVTGTMWNLGAVHPQIGSEDTCDLIRCDKGIPFCGKSHLPSACCFPRVLANPDNSMTTMIMYTDYTLLFRHCF